MGNTNCCAVEGGEKPMLLREESVNFIIEKTQATREDVEAYYNNFIQTYPDGKIDKKGFSEIMQKCFPDQYIEELDCHIFRMYDLNDEGKIDFRELLLVITVISRGTPQENLEHIFRVFDFNNDVSISKKDVYRIVTVFLQSDRNRR